jgi:hypothetical protein
MYRPLGVISNVNCDQCIGGVFFFIKQLKKKNTHPTSIFVICTDDSVMYDFI